MSDSLGAAVIGGGVLCFSICMTHTFYHSRRTSFQTILCWTLCVLFVCLSGSFFHLFLGSHSEELAGLFLIFAYLYLFDVPVRQRLFTFFFINTFLYAAVLMAKYTALLLCDVCPAFFFRFGYLIFYFIYTFLCLWIYWKKLREPVSQWLLQFGRHSRGAAVFAGAGYFLMLLLFDVWGNGAEPADYLNAALYLILLAAGYSLAFFHMAAAGEADEAKRRAERTAEELKQSEQYYETLTVHQQKIRRMQHDMRHHFRVLESCLRSGQLQYMQSYLEDLLENIPERTGQVLCANYTAGILLGYYAERAGTEGIRFLCDAQIPAEISVHDSHLSVVLGNALQNALEACQRLPDREARFINLLARVRGGFLTLEVKNSFDGMVIYDSGGRIKSGKPEDGHGLGLESVADIAGQYHGYYFAGPEGKTFVLRVVLGLTTE